MILHTGFPLSRLRAFTDYVLLCVTWNMYNPGCGRALRARARFTYHDSLMTRSQWHERHDCGCWRHWKVHAHTTHTAVSA